MLVGFGCDTSQPAGDLVLGAYSLTVLETSPTADATDVPLTSSISAIVNTPLNSDSVVNPNTNTPTGAFVVKDESGAALNGVVTYNPNTLTVTFTPADALGPGRRYTATLRDLLAADGGALNLPVSWSFVTLPPAASSSLAVSSTNPPAGTTGVRRNSAIQVTFNRELQHDSLVNPMTNTSTGAFLLKTPAGANVAGTITYNPTTSTVVFVPTAYLSANLTYIASIGDVRSLDGRALPERYTWTFTSGAEPSALPAIVSTTPVDGAMNVSRDTNIMSSSTNRSRASPPAHSSCAT
jgi:hypothetical protein